MSDHYDRYNGMENLLGTNLAEVGTDLISRQAAIEALKNRQDDGKGDISRFYNTIIQHDIEAIEQLPTAQPEQLEQCPIYGGMCAYPSDQCYDCPRHAERRWR